MTTFPAGRPVRRLGCVVQLAFLQAELFGEVCGQRGPGAPFGVFQPPNDSDSHRRRPLLCTPLQPGPKAQPADLMPQRLRKDVSGPRNAGITHLTGKQNAVALFLCQPEDLEHPK